MELTLLRYGFGKKTTLSRLMHGDVFCCYMIEDARRAAKIPGQTCIPEGVYELALYDSPKFRDTAREILGYAYKGMILLKNVPHFDFCEIHWGNDENATDGCLLTGSAPLVLLSGEFYVQNSRQTFKKVYPRIAEPLSAGERVTIDIRAMAGPELRVA